jgi:signal recognition particle subunit SRP54
LGKGVDIMAFDSLSNRLNKALRDLSGKGRLTEKNMEEMLKEVRVALLEADVNYKIVKDFLVRVKEKSLGTDVLEAVDPSSMVVKIVHDEIVDLLGSQEVGLNYKDDGITVVMMVGLQGTGKTTSIAKVANLVKKKQNRNPLLVAADIIRPAAIEQLQTLGKSIDVEVFTKGVETSAVDTVRLAMDYAKEKGYDTVFIDTAGRLHIDEELMNELKEIESLVHPQDILLTVDAMTGQDIVQVANSFHDL